MLLHVSRLFSLANRVYLHVEHVGGGLNGLMDPVAPGFACGSDTAHMSIFGYDPFMYVYSLLNVFILIKEYSCCRHYRGRGSFEAMGAGLHMDPGDVAFKCNFATIKEVLETIFVFTRITQS